MTDLKFRILPYGLEGWRVEKEKEEEYCVRVGFFFTRNEVRIRKIWVPVYRMVLINASDGRIIDEYVAERWNDWSPYRQHRSWPNDKDEIKKILDKELEKHRLNDEYDRAIEHRMATVLPEEYP